MWVGQDPRLLDTPDNPPPIDYVCRRLFIPNDPQWLSLVNGVISLLLMPSMYRRREEGQSVLETTNYFADMFLSFLGYDPMIGTVLPSLAANLPVWALWCDGTTYLKAQFPDLYDAIHPDFKDTVAETFTLPDLNGRFLVGTTDIDAVGQTGGEEEVTLTEAQMPTHFHLYTPTVTNNLDLEAPGAPDILGAGVLPLVSSSTQPAGGSEAHENRPPFFTLRFYIVAARRECW